ncbi:MAG: M48 family metallopeptidase [Candidatus Cloacimonetes bacterium]|nr:M48 family metallopeptidase [Candidatus Cloacimonadota bacterium]
MTEIEYIILYKDVKNACVRIISSTKVGLTVPLNYTQDKIAALLAQKQSWIDKKLILMAQREEAAAIYPDIFPLLGENYKVIFQNGLLNSVRFDSQKLHLYTGIKLDTPESRAWIYKLRAQKYLKPRAYYTGFKDGFPLKKVIIRGQKHKWGTCSSRGNISLNWKLMMAPEYVVDYIIAHELMHLRYMNHGLEYKRELRKYFLRTEEAETWLKAHGNLLKMY